MRVPSPAAVPSHPAPGGLDSLTTVWSAAREFFRCYDAHWGARDFSTETDGLRGRFHPFAAAGQGTPVPVLYGAGTAAGALSETVFHDVPIRGTKHVDYGRLRHRLLTHSDQRGDLTLIDLTSDGLSSLRVSRAELACTCAAREGITIIGSH